MTPTPTPVTVHRQPVVHADRSVLGYALDVVVAGSTTPDGLQRDSIQDDAQIDAQHADLDLEVLAGGLRVFIGATAGVLATDWPHAEPRGGLTLEVPRRFTGRPETAGHLVRLRATGRHLALADYVPDGDQDALLALVDLVKVDLSRGEADSAGAIARAHAHGVSVVAKQVNTEAAVHFCTAHGVDLLQGPLFQRDATPTARRFSTGELQVLQLTALLAADDVDPRGVVRVIGSDPELTMRVLRLVNSGAVGARHRIDSVRRAVVMLGPQPLLSLAVTSLVGARSDTSAGLWAMLTRAGACRSLVGNDAAYTVGLLSAAAAQLRVAPADLVARTGVSDDVGDALLTLSGPFGPTLAAVLAHEENDDAGVAATGLDPAAVARAYLGAVADAHAVAATLTV
ncbi:MAG: EAL and HDOD domain-containing protein [Cellulomonas sp.]